MLVYTNYKDIFKLSKEELEKIDVDLFDFLKFWNSSNATIEVKTSGSTGSPKKIRQEIFNVKKSYKKINYFNIFNFFTL